MKSFTFLASALAATPALAHEGPHLHPHGYEAAIVAALLIAAFTVVTLLRVR